MFKLYLWWKKVSLYLLSLDLAQAEIQAFSQGFEKGSFVDKVWL